MPDYAPQDVTEQTLADPDEKARIESPGNVFWEEGFESPDALDPLARTSSMLSVTAMS